MSYNPDLQPTTSSRSAVTSLKDRVELDKRRTSELNSTPNLTNRFSRANINSSETALDRVRNEDDERSLRTSSANVNLQNNESKVIYRGSTTNSVRKSVTALPSLSNFIKKSVTSFIGKSGSGLQNNDNLQNNEDNDNKIEMTYSDLNDAYKSDINEDDEEENDLRSSFRKSSISNGRNSIMIESRNSERRSTVSSLREKSNSQLVRSRLDNPESRKRTVSECGEESNTRLLLELDGRDERAFSDTEVDNMELELCLE